MQNTDIFLEYSVFLNVRPIVQTTMWQSKTRAGKINRIKKFIEFWLKLSVSQIGTMRCDFGPPLYTASTQTNTYSMVCISNYICINVWAVMAHP